MLRPFSMSKTTPLASNQSASLPASVKKMLMEVMPTPMKPNNLSDQEKIDQIQKHFTEILKILGLDLQDDSLKDSPKRIAKMYVKEIFKGLEFSNFPKITTIENKMNYDQMVVVKDIELVSTCEHHFQPIQGFATVAYIPNKKVIGLSKINRIVEYFAKRPQVQERLTKQVADCLQQILGTSNVAVHMNAKHFCVIARGIEDLHSSTVTCDLRGEFKKNAQTRQEFLLHARTQLS